MPVAQIQSWPAFPGGFYRKDNLRRLWNQVRNGGGQQSCHLTDPSHPDHVAAGAPANAQVRECAGSIALIRREIEKLRQITGGPDAQITGEAIDHYLEQNPRGISKRGMAYWILQRLELGGAPIIGGPIIPDVSRDLIDDHDRIARLPE